MNKFWLVFAVLSFTVMLNAIEVSGNQSGTWSPANNPYQLIGDVTVPAGSSLTIQQGVNVEAMGEYRINVQGSITAEGSSTSMIHFYSNDGSQWTGLRLDNADAGSSFAYCTIEHAENGVNTLNSQMVVSNCHFDNNETGIHVFGLNDPNPPEVVIEDNLIENCQQNGIMIYEHNPIITNNELRQCALDQSPRAAIQLSCQSAGGICQPQILDNHIHDNVWQGITAWDIYADGDISPTVKGNIIEENLTGVYLYDASGYFENNIIRNNFVAGNANSGAGVMLYGATTYPTFCQNIITGNFTGFYIVNGADANLGDQTPMSGRNLIYGNVDESMTTHSIYSASAEEIKAENCFWDSTVPEEIEETITGNVDFDPLYGPGYTAIGFITGSIHELDENDVYVNLIRDYNRDVDAIGSITVDSTYFLPVRYADDYYVHVQEIVTEDSRQGVYGGVDTPILLQIDEETITTGIDIYELVDELPLRRSIEEPIIQAGEELFPYRFSESIFWRKDYLLYDDGQGIRIIAFVDQPGVSMPIYPVESCWLIMDDPQPGDTWNSARLLWNGEVQELTAVVTPYGGDNEVIIDYNRNYGDGIPVYRRRFVMDSGVMGEKEYYQWGMANDIQTDVSSIVGGEGYMPLCEGNEWSFVRNTNHDDPANLTAWPQQDNVYRLLWDPPYFQEEPDEWEGYYVYENGQLLTELPFEEFWTDIEVPLGVNEYYVRAFTFDEYSEPTNVVTIEVVSVGEEPEPTPQDFLSAQLFPNPARLASGSGVSMSIVSSSAPEINLYNVRGQKIQSWRPEANDQGRYHINWNGADATGKQVASGIYFARIKSSHDTLVKKVVLLR